MLGGISYPNRDHIYNLVCGEKMSIPVKETTEISRIISKSLRATFWNIKLRKKL
jgi:hypothetical protein